jgi:hypothetical protein
MKPTESNESCYQQCLVRARVLETMALALLFAPAVNRWYREEN